jgi:energy-coupling factor transport system ATP-binding protein
MQKKIIRINGLCVKYFDSEKYALNKIDLSVNEGEIVSIMGSAGSGKTTLLLTLNGIIPHSLKVKMSGKVEVNDLDTQKYSVMDFSKIVGVVFQDPDNQLFCASVEEEVGYALSNHGLPRELIKNRVREALHNVRLEGYEERIPQGLSGGEKQRVAIASALSLYPKILVLDEPTSQLDPMGTTEIFEVLRRLRTDKKITIIVSEHKSEEIADIADKVVVLKLGEKVFEGEPKDVFRLETITDYGIRAPQVAEAVNFINLRLEPGEKPINPIPITFSDALKHFKQKSG